MPRKSSKGAPPTPPPEVDEFVDTPEEIEYALVSDGRVLAAAVSALDTITRDQMWVEFVANLSPQLRKELATEMVKC